MPFTHDVQEEERKSAVRNDRRLTVRYIISVLLILAFVLACILSIGILFP